MVEDRTVPTDDVAPANDRAVDLGDELRVPFADVRADERACGVHGGRLEEREVSMLPGNAVDGGMEAVDVVLSDGDDSIVHTCEARRPGNVSCSACELRRHDVCAREAQRPNSAARGGPLE